MARRRAGKIKKIFVISGITVIFLLAASLSVFAFYASQIPDPGIIAARQINESTKIFDRSGETILYDIHGEEKRTVVAWDQIADWAKKATLASEDKDFYNHRGIDFSGIFRALYKDLASLSASQGGSTITQQLVKNSLLGREKSISRKIKEVALSIGVERKFTKDEIFWMYLNQIPYGSNAYGVEAASQTFFGKKAAELSISEAALVASLPKAPGYLSPYGNHFSELINRRNDILQKMLGLNFITPAEYEQALNESPKIRPSQDAIGAPHFVIMVREYLVKKYGEDMVTNGGLKVVTSLDANLQKIAEEVVSKFGKVNEKNYKAKNAALAAADPKTGQILAMVGSRDYFDVENEGNFNVALALRQPGSAFKPFAYAKAFEKGFTDSTVLFDLQTEFNPLCDSSSSQDKDVFGQDCYHPQNYDGRFRGPVTMRQALAQSLNIPSVKTLYLAGVEETMDLAQRMGITSLKDRSRFGLSLVLGGAEVRLVDMVSAYGVFANDGVLAKPSFILSVSDKNGVVLEKYEKDEQRIMEPQIARLISDILSDNSSRSQVFGFNSPLNIPGRQVAAKTGTTQENKDGWLVGYSPTLTAGVWTGNNDNTPMTRRGAGVSAAGPMWQEFMTRALADSPVEQFSRPDPVVSEKIILNGSYLDRGGIRSILFYIDKNNPSGSYPSNPGDDPQFKNWDEAVSRVFGRQ